MKLTFWHYDRYPTAPGVYLGVFPQRGHKIIWVEGTTAERGGLKRWQEDGVERWIVARRRDATGRRPWVVIRNRVFKLRGFLRKVRLLWQLASEQPDVLQVRELVTEGLVAWVAARRFGVRFAFYFDYPHYEARLHEWDRLGRSALLGRWTARWWMFWRDFLLRRADLVLPISEAMRDRLHDRLGLRPERMQVFPVGVDRELWEEVGRVAPLDLDGLDLDRPVVGYMGNLAAIRDPAFLLDVVEEVLGARKDAQFLLIASVPEPVRLRLAASPYSGRVLEAGFRPRLEALRLLRHADVGLFPLPTKDPYGVFYTSSPLKVVEYLSAGVPVVSSRNGDAEQLLAASSGGVVVDNEVSAFAGAVLSLLDDPERARTMGQRGRDHVGAHRTFDALALPIEAAYERLIGARKETAPTRDAGSGARWAS
jgi:glycosyltransferase involved in cell wall biosynthesis